MFDSDGMAKYYEMEATIPTSKKYKKLTTLAAA